ncbi:MAG: cytochrome d ubiquinol oxidase subunit II [Verrucomicrobiota bacterium]
MLVHLDLPTFWFAALAFFWMGYFVLEGFDFGVGMLTPFVAKDEVDRQLSLNTILPVWDGNEVWLIVAGAGTFAAFPDWYATLFSAYFLPLLLIVLALAARAVAFKYRTRHDTKRWRAAWTWAIALGSALPALLFGVAFAGIYRGIPVNGQMEFTGNFLDLVHPYALLGGVCTLALSLMQGAAFLSFKTTGGVRRRAGRLSFWLSIAAALAVLVFTLATEWGVNRGIIPDWTATAAILLAAAAAVLASRGREPWTFLASSVTIVFFFISYFSQLYPDVLVSSTRAEWSLTVYNASSSHYTLVVMTVAALLGLPAVLFYQWWTYRVFRGRLTREQFEPH